LSREVIYLLSPLKKEGTLSLPMIRFSMVATSIDFLDVDTLMFTSKQAVVSANAIDASWKNYPSIAIGKATKSKIEELGGDVIYTPKSFYGDQLAQDIKAFFSNRKILYLRPKVVSFDSKAYLKASNIDLKEQVIYETRCQTYTKLQEPKENAIIIFTSPSTIHCFFKNFKWKDSYRAVLIGRATEAHLPIGCQFWIADEPLIDACIKKALEIAKNESE